MNLSIICPSFSCVSLRIHSEVHLLYTDKDLTGILNPPANMHTPWRALINSQGVHVVVARGVIKKTI